jgi:hypothetical protein
MQNTQKDRDHYPDEPPPLPEYDISPSLKKLVLICIGTMLINFLIAGACAVAMRILQTDVHIRHIAHLGIPDNVLFYSLLTSHGQVMFFGVLSLNTFWFSYYAVSKWGRKSLASMKLAAISFWIMEGAVILLFLDTVLHFGAGWYNLMPLAFLPGFPVITWDLTAALIFQIADVLVGIAITIFCIVILATLLRGKLPVGNQIFEYIDTLIALDGNPESISAVLRKKIENNNKAFWCPNQERIHQSSHLCLQYQDNSNLDILGSTIHFLLQYFIS